MSLILGNVVNKKNAKNDRWGWGFWLFVVTLVATVFFVVYGALWYRMAHAQNHTKAPEEPPPSMALEWEAHRSLGVIVRYEIGGLSIWFAHPVQQRRVAAECGPIYVMDGIMYFTTINEAPVRYETSAEATGYKWAGEPFWTPLIQKSFCRSCN